ncbi:complement receptor type 2-like [Pseudorasbora parva]|uniref:complement receptor type 2-like n=1 Tax=Pseudorasbora parva TaxID=51549 RepID=UPI00351E670F
MEDPRVFCPPPAVANRLVKRRERPQYEPQDTATIICSKGYELIGSSVVTCGSDGQWVDLPECRLEETKIFCSAPVVANRLVKRRERNQYEPQDTATIICSKGYDLVGSSVVTCGTDGQWLNLPECVPEDPIIFCSAPVVENRWVNRRERTQYEPQETVTITCKDGFDLIGSSVVTCGSDGHWVNLPECRVEDPKIFCSAPVVANRLIRRREKTQYEHRDTFTIICGDGYELIGSSVVTCGSDGQWLDLPLCHPEDQKIFCSAPDVANRVVKRRERTQYDPQDTVTIVCSKGFYLIGSSVVTCGSNGQWVDLPVCQPEGTVIYCSVPDVANRLVKRRERPQYEPQDTFTIICREGFDLIGSSVVTCGLNGQWLDLPECRPEAPKIFCSAPSVANRLIKRVERTQYDPLETETIICSKGFDLIGSSVVTCGADGQWLDLPECRLEEQTIFCSAPAVENRLVKRGERMQYEPQDTVIIICKKGFDLIGSSVVTCGLDGHWLNLPECVPEEQMHLCSAPVVPNRWVKRKERMQYEPQETVTIICRDGFDLIGSSVVTCGSDGQWLDLPECRHEDPKTYCLAPVVANRLVRRGERPQYDPQDTFTIICSKGYDLIGSSVVTCGADGHWLDLPECRLEETKIYCSAPVVPHRLVKRRERLYYEPQDTVTIICRKGYDLIGSSVVTCGPDGQWLNLPECRHEETPIFCSAPFVANRLVDRDERPQYEPQETVTITCRDGFYLTSSSVVTCGSDGQWLNLPECIYEDPLSYCSAPDVANRLVKHGERTQYEPQDTFTIICSKGFDLIGSPVVTCGSNGQWLDLPECHPEETPIFCSAPDVPNRWVKRRERTLYEPQETVTIICRDGFYLIGSSVVTCGPDGQWLNLPECIYEEPKIFCSAPAVANRWIKPREKTLYKPQETATITCNQGFELIGSLVVTCGPDGHWLDLPVCRPEGPMIYCSAPAVTNRWVKRGERTHYEPQDTFAIICRDRFDLIGSPVVTCGADGQWLDLPECRPEEIKIYCPAPNVANRLVKRGERTQYEPKETVTIFCRDGYDLYGSSVVTCGSDGQWLDLPDCCHKDVFCPALSVANRWVKSGEKTQYKPQETVTITCSKGYHLVGSSVVTCGSDGQWSHFPECRL